MAHKLTTQIAELLGYTTVYSRPVAVLARQVTHTTATDGRGAPYAYEGDWVVRFGDMLIVLTDQQFRALYEVPHGEQSDWLDASNAAEGQVDGRPVARIVERQLASVGYPSLWRELAGAVETARLAVGGTAALRAEQDDDGAG